MGGLCTKNLSDQVLDPNSTPLFSPKPERRDLVVDFYNNLQLHNLPQNIVESLYDSKLTENEENMSELRRRSLKKKRLRLGYHKYFENPRQEFYDSPMNPESGHKMNVSPPISPNFDLRKDFKKGGIMVFGTGDDLGEEEKFLQNTIENKLWENLETINSHLKLANEEEVSMRFKFEILKKHIPNMILHEMSGSCSKRYFRDDYEDDQKMLDEMDKLLQRSDIQEKLVKARSQQRLLQKQVQRNQNSVNLGVYNKDISRDLGHNRSELYAGKLKNRAQLRQLISVKNLVQDKEFKQEKEFIKFLNNDVLKYITINSVQQLMKKSQFRKETTYSHLMESNFKRVINQDERMRVCRLSMNDGLACYLDQNHLNLCDEEPTKFQPLFKLNINQIKHAEFFQKHKIFGITHPNQIQPSQTNIRNGRTDSKVFQHQKLTKGKGIQHQPTFSEQGLGAKEKLFLRIEVFSPIKEKVPRPKRALAVTDKIIQGGQEIYSFKDCQLEKILPPPTSNETYFLFSETQMINNEEDNDSYLFEEETGRPSLNTPRFQITPSNLDLKNKIGQYYEQMVEQESSVFLLQGENLQELKKWVCLLNWLQKINKH